MMSRLLIVGAGGHGRSVAEAAKLSLQFDLVGFIDDSMKIGDRVLDVPVLGGTTNCERYLSSCDRVIVAVGNNKIRELLIQKLIAAGFDLAVVVHPRAIISPSAILGPGTVIMAGAIIGTEAFLGVGVIANCGAVVDHHASVADYGHLGVNVSMAGESILGCSAWMHAGTALTYGSVVPPGAILSAASEFEKNSLSTELVHGIGGVSE